MIKLNRSKMIEPLSPSLGANSIISDIILVVAVILFSVIAVHVSGGAKVDMVEDLLKATYFPLRSFYRDSCRLVKRCTKPSKQGKLPK